MYIEYISFPLKKWCEMGHLRLPSTKKPMKFENFEAMMKYFLRSVNSKFRDWTWFQGLFLLCFCADMTFSDCLLLHAPLMTEVSNWRIVTCSTILLTRLFSHTYELLPFYVPLHPWDVLYCTSWVHSKSSCIVSGTGRVKQTFFHMLYRKLFLQCVFGCHTYGTKWSKAKQQHWSDIFSHFHWNTLTSLFQWETIFWVVVCFRLHSINYSPC